jgi:site-specific DNA-methyltransferase (adenine-specific)
MCVSETERKGEMKMTVVYTDCVEEMGSWPDKSVDMILTSPPFKDEDVEGDYWEFFDSFFKQAVRVTKNVVIIIHSATKVNEYIKRYPPKRILIWGKGVIQPSYRYNPIYVYQIGDHYKVNKYIWTDTIGIAPIKGSQKVHKYQDPVQLYSVLIKMFKDCNIVCDPFCGSGTCLIAAKENNREFVGIEKDFKWIDVVNDRLREEN